MKILLQKILPDLQIYIYILKYLKNNIYVFFPINEKGKNHVNDTVQCSHVFLAQTN
jgi:hypothetical protein